jgi:hypothetical protein
MKKQILSEEFKRMQKLAGILTEEETNVESKKELEQLKKDAFNLIRDPKLNALAKKIMSGISITDKEKLTSDLINIVNESDINNKSLNEDQDEYSLFSKIVDKQIEKLNNTSESKIDRILSPLDKDEIPDNITLKDKEKLLKKAREILDLDQITNTINKYKKGEEVPFSFLPADFAKSGLFSLISMVIGALATSSGFERVIGIGVGVVIGLLVRQINGPEQSDRNILAQKLKHYRQYEKDIDDKISNAKTKVNTDVLSKPTSIEKPTKPESPEDYNKRLYGF